jgi:uncharacterized membrane protein
MEQTENPVQPSFTDEKFESIVGNLLRLGVMLAAGAVFVGGSLYLLRHGAGTPEYYVFRGEPDALRTIPGIIEGAFSFRGRAIIQLGLLILIATPVARVAFSVYGFLRQRDGTYVIITLIVLAVLLFSLAGGEL